ncbi:MAG TPA: hypothetical protein VM582_04430 [Candidatus Thermoplasmatota archaeon]|nr:hypothetical protein [Candidatus Thermoplasmatota archaeon]
MRTLVILSALLLLGSATATRACEPEFTLEAPTGTYYVDAGSCEECIFSLWIYQETDGEPGCDGESQRQ